MLGLKEKMMSLIRKEYISGVTGGRNIKYKEMCNKYLEEKEYIIC